MDYLGIVLCAVLAWMGIHLLFPAARKDSSITVSKPRKLPPGPRGLPIIGNLLSLGPNPHISLAQVARKYGPLMTLHLGRVPTVVISSAVVAKEALQKNDLSLSNRTVLDAVRAMNHHESIIVWLPVSPLWRNLRKVCNTHMFSATRLDATQSLRRNKVNELVSYVQECSAAGVTVDIGQAAFGTTLNLLANTFMSAELGGPDSEFARKFKETVRGIMFEAGTPNSADYFPLLRKMDPQGIRQRMSVHFQKLIENYNIMIDQRSQNKMKSSSVQGSDVLDALLGNISKGKTDGIEESNILNLLLDMYVAGPDRTSSTLEWAMAELLHNPDKLNKLKSELREVIEEGKQLEESHLSQLPYLQAVVKETLRLHPAVPFLVPRQADSDVRLSGYTVPKNAQVLVNVWAIGRDPSVWDKPNQFNPERFVGSEIDVKGCDFEVIPFGAGRRMCPGMPLAIQVLQLMVGSLIHGFDWKLESGVPAEKMNMDEKYGFTMEKAQRLCAIPIHV